MMRRGAVDANPNHKQLCNEPIIVGLECAGRTVRMNGRRSPNMAMKRLEVAENMDG